MNKFYVTTAIAYVNSPAHLGFALELLQADVLARYNRLLGKDVFFLTGTDEHGAKIVRAAEAKKKDVKEFADEIAENYKDLTKTLNISNDDFIRTSDQERHWPSVQKIWLKLEEAGDLYKKNYKGYYCVGHEAFMKKSDLRNGTCPDHQTEPEVIEEENWFFKLTKYTKIIKERIESGEFKIYPESRKNEVLRLLADAEDISFSRPSKDLSWGIPVPNDPTQTMYVWADALSNYVSALDYFNESEKFKKYWPADIHLIGKDILRFHAIIWPAILLSAGLPLPKALNVHGFITVDGQKMSKTIGNVIDPFDLVERYDLEAVRYFLLREIASGDDGDFSYSKLERRYNSDLANTLGNLVSRTLMLIDKNLNGQLIFEENIVDAEIGSKINEAVKKYGENINKFSLHDALGDAFSLLDIANSYIDEKKPWALVKDDPAAFLAVMTTVTKLILSSTWLIYPFMPKTSEKIFDLFGAEDKFPPEGLDERQFNVKPDREALFPKING